MPISPIDVEKIREIEFSEITRSKITYLNNAGTGPLPMRTVATLNDWATRRSMPWTVSDQEDVFPALNRVRGHCAKMIGAQTDEIALTPNTSHGLSFAANALPLTPDDVVLTSEREFPSIVYACQAAAVKKGFHVKTVSAQGEPVDEEALFAALDEPRVRAVFVSWVSFATGQRIDLERLGQACRERDIFLVVDAMQGVGCSVLDVNACHADIVSVGGHKWLLSPWGTGFLYVRRELVTKLQPPTVGWFVGPASENYERMLDYDLTYFDDARRFEVMTLPVQDLIAMGASLELLLELGLGAVERHIQQLCDRLFDGLAGCKGVSIITPDAPSRRAGLVTFALPDPDAASAHLRKAGIVHSLRENKIRFAPHFYNTVSEIDKSIERLINRNTT